jgi:hypothetical protein
MYLAVFKTPFLDFMFVCKLFCRRNQLNQRWYTCLRYEVLAKQSQSNQSFGNLHGTQACQAYQNNAPTGVANHDHHHDDGGGAATSPKSEKQTSVAAEICFIIASGVSVIKFAAKKGAPQALPARFA